MMLSTGLLKLTPPSTDSQRRRARRLAEGVSLWLAVLLMLFVHPLYADASEPPGGGQVSGDTAGTLRFVDDAGRWQEPALVVDSEFAIKVGGLIAETRLARRFRNTSADWREGVFVFPLPEQASVYGLTMTVGERTIVGRVQPRAQARKTYEQASSAGQGAAHVEQQRPNLFTARVANIPPGETVSVVLQYQQPVTYRAGGFELRVPTTLTPRYMPGQPVRNEARQWQGGWALPTSQVADADAISPHTVRAADLTPDSHRASIHMSIDAGLPLARVTSPSHSLRTRQDGHTVQVQPAQDRVLMDQDFVVRWQPLAGQEPTAAVFHQRWQDEDYLLAMILPSVRDTRALPRELVFVIDTSGSMAGSSIRQARSALQQGLATLTPGDRFNVIQFNNQTHGLFMQPEPATANNLARARRYVGNLQADGGTEMAPALARALAGQGAGPEPDRSRVRQVVFITDGAVGNEAALFQQIRDQLGDQRLFTVGIGSAPNMHFMREAARWGRGLYTAIQDPADVAGPLQDLFAALEAPVLTDVQVQWPGHSGNRESFPARTGDLFRGEPMMQVVRGVSPAGVLQVSGRMPDGLRWQRSLDLQQAAPGLGLNRHWARQKIDHLQDTARLEGREPDRGSITQLAVTHTLMSPYTSFVAVDEATVRLDDAQGVKEQLPTLLPAGSEAGMLRYPQTATLAPLLTALGLVGLMFALALVLLQRGTRV